MANSKKSEQAAIKAIVDYFIDSIHIDCNISTNDKGPLWDEYLYYHKDEPFTGDNLIARIPVQVKGRSLKWRKNTHELTVNKKTPRAAVPTE